MKKFGLSVGAVVVASSLVACGEETSVEEVEGTEEAEAENLDAEETEEDEDEDEEENEDEDEDEDEEDEFGTRVNPVPHGQTVEVEGSDWLFGDVHYDIELIESVSGDEAESMVKEANQFNEPSEDGKEYILAKVRIQLHSAEEEPFDVNAQQFDVISEGGSSYEDFVSVAELDPEFRSDLYEGGEVEGWAPFLVDSDDEKPLIKYNDVWFDLRGEE
ncbi:DUF4352 domain-containing protein [Thalassorhabdus alkalitolerans]|uniref:DUF4352 domain-containing protein n=1 Tax=Thalassorhabdus alkalitolerans TaxID=2282697 RepID=A0ABW0YUF1_9BACI